MWLNTTQHCVATAPGAYSCIHLLLLQSSAIVTIWVIFACCVEELVCHFEIVLFPAQPCPYPPLTPG